MAIERKKSFLNSSDGARPRKKLRSEPICQLNIITQEESVLRCVNLWLRSALPAKVELTVAACSIELSADGLNIISAKVSCPACPKKITLSIQDNRVLNSNFRRHFLSLHSSPTNQPRITRSFNNSKSAKSSETSQEN